MRSLRLCALPPCPMSTRGRGPDGAAGCHTTPGMICPLRSTAKPRSQIPLPLTASSVQLRCAMSLSPLAWSIAIGLPRMLASIPGPKAPMLRRGQAGNHLPHPSHAPGDRKRRAGAAHVGAHPPGMHDDGDHALLAPLWSQGTQGVVEGRLGVSVEPETSPPSVAKI